MEYEPIKENRDFRHIYSRGKNLVSPVVVCYTLKNHCGKVRMGITTSKRIGNAVQRNRSRRVIRAAFWALLPHIRPGHDFIFVARAKTPYVKSTVVKHAMEQQLKKAGLYQ
ncbi:MAG: ribonuclease P protein component [Oscillospiraceae bacterium]|jgi:ribonuclease P protein component|nr:ribonuclease P protein component [Oscillospiraceae bacterium]MDD3260993.1 ribonuclease P protein component [Oscillospiraceae bacterium]